MKNRTLYGIKKNGEIPTDGIYVKNEEEAGLSANSNIKYHQNAEQYVINLLKPLNLEKYTKEPTEIDLIGELDGKIIYIEVERDYATRKWTTSKNFPYPLINIPIEKRRHFQKYRHTSFYLKFNRPMYEVFIIHGEDILSNTKKQNLTANHNNNYAERTFLRAKKEFALFTNAKDSEKIIEFISSKIGI